MEHATTAPEIIDRECVPEAVQHLHGRMNGSKFSISESSRLEVISEKTAKNAGMGGVFFAFLTSRKSGVRIPPRPT
jgi:hypothetical protein